MRPRRTYCDVVEVDPAVVVVEGVCPDCGHSTDPGVHESLGGSRRYFRCAVCDSIAILGAQGVAVEVVDVEGVP